MKTADYLANTPDALRLKWYIECKNWGDRQVSPQAPNYIQVSSHVDAEKPDPEMSLIENAVFQVNPELDDHEWRKQFFDDMPHYLSRYFANRYNKTYEKAGRQAANSYLLKTVGGKINPRLKKVLARYQRQFRFRADYVHASDLSREKLLAEMDKSEIKILAQQFADFFGSKIEPLIASEKDRYKEYDKVIVSVFELLQAQCKEFGYTPPYANKDQLHQSEAECGILRLVCQRAWENKLNKKRMIMREHLAIAVGQVQKAASPYCSYDCVHEWKNQKQRNRDFIKGMSVFDEDSGEEIALSEMFYKSTANPAIRRCELMVRMRGYENIAEAMGCQGLFLTLTAPSKYHHTKKIGGFVKHWNGSSPRDAQAYLCNVWAKIRAQFKRDDISVFGIRVVEPHHDGTSHWHLLLFMQPHDAKKASEVFTQYAVEEDFKELFPSINKTEITVGPPNLRTRCEVVDIDPNLGSATGYIAKYISKNIDGYAMENEKDDETGREQKEMAAHVTAWASRWRIRQFQPIGGAPVTTYRELRRYANNDKNAFKSFVATLNNKQQYDLFLEQFPEQNPNLIGPRLNFHGPRLDYRKMNATQRWDVITGKYKAKLKTGFDAYRQMLTNVSDEKLRVFFYEYYPTESPDFIGPKPDICGPKFNYDEADINQRCDVIAGKYSETKDAHVKLMSVTASDAMKAADKGDFAGYVMAQGGPFVKRKDLLIRNDYEGIAQGNEYGEFIVKLQGFQVMGDEAINTRTRQWRIQPKSQELLDHEARTSSAEGAEVLTSPAGASRSSVNNCTRSPSDRLNTGIKALLKRRCIHLDDHLVDAMRQGGQVRVDKDLIVKIRGGYYADSKYHPPELVDITPEKPNIWDGWNSPATSKQDKAELADGWCEDDFENWKFECY